MGAYLNKPKTDVVSSDHSSDTMSCGASAMQGWRVSMEDAHTCELNFDKNTSLFGVFDGHGGSEVAIYAQKHLANVLKKTEGYKKGDEKQGLTEAFFQLDEEMITEEGLTELKEIAGDNGDDSGDENEAELLTQEAAIPLKELLERLKGVPGNDKDDEEESGSDEEQETNGDIENKNGKAHSHEEESKEDHSSNNKPSVGKNGESKISEENDESEEGKVDEKDDEQEDNNDNAEDDDGEEDDEQEDNNDNAEDDDDDEDDDDGDDDNDNGVVLKSDEVGYDSGTTAIVALVKGDLLTVANAGDSRCVVCRNGIALEMSIDHKPEDIKELDRIQKAGGKVTGEGRVNGGLNLSRALGDHSYKGQTELKAEEQQITALPDIRQTILTSADEFMVIACDGIWNVKNSQEVVDFVHKELKEQKQNDDVNLSSICEKLFKACLAPDTSGDGSGCDNMTCMIVTFDNIPATVTSGKRKSQEDNDNPKPEKKTRTDIH